MGRQRGKWETLAVERHQRDLALAKRKSGHPRGLWFDDAAGQRPIDFIERYCKHYKGEWAGRPLLLGPWQKDDILRPIFGWKRHDGTRRFRRAWVEIPRKNGKTLLAAGVGIYLLVGDGEPGAEVYATATKQDQAKLLWDAAAAMVRASPDLRRFIRSYRSKGGTLFCDRLGSKMVPLGSDSKTLDGLNPHGDIRDEVHQWTNHDLVSVLQTALGARRQPLTLEITTAGVYDPNGVGWQHHEYATQVLEGAFEDDRQFVFISAIDDDDDPYSPATWEKANPNYGVSVKPSFVAEEAEQAKRTPRLTNDFLRLQCNRWTQQITRWLSVEKWRDCDRVANPLEERPARELELRTRRACAGGLDLASKLDMAAFVVAFPGDDDTVELLARFWVPEERVEEEAKAGRKHYEQWVKDGWLAATPGAVIDYKFIRAEILGLRAAYPSLNDIGFDPWNAQQFATDLAEDDGFQMVEMRQGFQSLSEPSKDFEARIAALQIRHGGNPVLAWMVGNAVIRKDPAGNIKPDKEKAKGKIDGVVASIMALARLSLPSASSGNPYTPESGLLVLRETPVAATGPVDDPDQIHPFLRGQQAPREQQPRVDPFLRGE